MAESETPGVPRDPRTEAALKAIALWYPILGCVPGLAILKYWPPPGIPVAYMVALVLAGTLPMIVGLRLGYGLARFDESARRSARSLHALMLVFSFVLPIAAIDLIYQLKPDQQIFGFWGGVLQFVLHLMWGSFLGSAAVIRVCRPDYPRTPPVSWTAIRESPYFWVPLVCIVLGTLVSVAMIQAGPVRRPAWLTWF